MNTVKVDFAELTKNTKTPVLTYCRKLVKCGEPVDTILEVFRGEMLCLVVKEIGKGAMLTVEEPDDRRGCSRMHWGKYTEFEM